MPTASGTGDNSDNSATGSSFDEVPLSRDEAIERDAAQGDDLPARADGDVARGARAGACGEGCGPPPRGDARPARGAGDAARGTRAGASGEVSGPTQRSGGRDA